MWKKALFGVCAALLCVLFITVPHAYAADQTTGAETPKRIELVLVIDKSGSMGGLESDTIGGFNSMVEKQRALHIPVHVTAVLFNDKAQTLYDHKAIWRVPPLTDHDYVTGGRQPCSMPSAQRSAAWSGRTASPHRGQRLFL
ncbi:hypothetical protein HMPREF9555_01881 [Selenomonas artemidis F0399]|jgi:hypothetical protein|uniref:VWFA domain-containing protein n=1 Tax=Selenomonas artemidis F0399 TaxID=749551 RepID=E7N4D8_9FIRM|nr:hypothetical protein HMPREF9555_01881 [Selenomonas artemidis F0399]